MDAGVERQQKGRMAGWDGWLGGRDGAGSRRRAPPSPLTFAPTRQRSRNPKTGGLTTFITRWPHVDLQLDGLQPASGLVAFHLSIRRAAQQ